MKSSEMVNLLRRARRSGIQPTFVDASGQRRKASPETLRAMVELLGEPEDAERAVPPVIVCWNGRAKNVRIEASAETKRSLRSEMEVALVVPRDDARQEPRYARLQRRSESDAVLQIPPLPFGYYQLDFDLDGRKECALVISSPVQAYHERNARDWGLFAPMYAVHSEQSWGAGNLTDWQRFCEWLAERKDVPPRLGSGKRSPNIVVATLPLLGAFLDDWKCEPSPYSPATRLFWNEFYIDVTRVPEFGASKAAQQLLNSTTFQRQIRQQRRATLVDYKLEMALKRRVLEKMAVSFFGGRTGRRESFQTFCRQHPELERYAKFRAACEKRQESWHSWPHRLRNGQLRAGDYDEDNARYHRFVQWIVEEQMEAVLAKCRELGVKFYLDLPLGVNPDGYDVWAHQDLFANGAAVGAPPDAFFTKGQNWGFPPLHPQRIRHDGYRYVIDYLRFQMRHTGLLRLDHVMALHRLWWIPPAGSPADGAYVSYNPEELYAVFSVESHLHRTTLIGENLGTVPPAVNRRMRRHGIRTMYVAQYEARANLKHPLRALPRECAASLNTHDMPTWSAFWNGLDITDRERLGLLTPRQARKEQNHRARLRLALTAFLRHRGRLPKGADAQAVLVSLVDFLGRSEAELVLVALEDAWLEVDPQNTPGTSTERINWRRKLRHSLEQIRERPAVLDLLQCMNEARNHRSPGRLARAPQ